MPRFRLGLVFAAAWLLAVLARSPVQAAERAFWVWNRMTPLTPAEVSLLNNAGIKRLYWQAGELWTRPDGGVAMRRTAPRRWADLNPAGGTLQIVPVVRVATSIRSPESFTGELLGQLLQPVAAASPDGTVQFDFDCPDRLLPVYAERLRTARQVANIKHLTITALDHWADLPASTALWSAVDEVFPMIYDTVTDPVPGPGGLDAWEPVPVLDPGQTRARLASWRAHCPLPWHAGLPTFARVTLYDAQGRSLGHLRRWLWEDLVFNPALRLARPPHLGTTLFSVATPVHLGTSTVPAGGLVAARWPVREELRAAIAEADAAGAKSVVLFRLPDPPENPSDTTGMDTGAGGWSLPQLGVLLAPASSADGTLTHPARIEAPRLRLSRATDGTERLVLRNDSDTDLPPRFGEMAGDRQHRGYALELDAPGPVWREALPGDFHRVNSHRLTGGEAAAEKPVAVPVPLATRLTFWFSHLPAHATLTTGLLQTAPDAPVGSLRYRLADDGGKSPGGSGDGAWQPLP